ncbi:unnamed protein product, partial [Brenthis ino]
MRTTQPYHLSMKTQQKHVLAATKLQDHVDEVEKWLNNWRANQSKSIHVTFTLRKQTVYNEDIPQTEDAKYLGIHLDSRSKAYLEKANLDQAQTAGHKIKIAA